MTYNINLCKALEIRENFDQLFFSSVTRSTLLSLIALFDKIFCAISPLFLVLIVLFFSLYYDI
jgi:hypothetical protein